MYALSLAIPSPFGASATALPESVNTKGTPFRQEHVDTEYVCYQSSICEVTDHLFQEPGASQETA